MIHGVWSTSLRILELCWFDIIDFGNGRWTTIIIIIFIIFKSFSWTDSIHHVFRQISPRLQNKRIFFNRRRSLIRIGIAVFHSLVVYVDDIGLILHHFLHNSRRHHILCCFVVNANKLHVFVWFYAFAVAGGGGGEGLVQLVSSLFQSLFFSAKISTTIIIKVVVCADLGLVVVNSNKLIPTCLVNILPELPNRSISTIYSREGTGVWNSFQSMRARIDVGYWLNLLACSWPAFDGGQRLMHQHISSLINVPFASKATFNNFW